MLVFIMFLRPFSAKGAVESIGKVGIALRSESKSASNGFLILSKNYVSPYMTTSIKLYILNSHLHLPF